MSAEKMDFKEFTETVTGNIRDYLPEQFRDAEITVKEYAKPGISYTAMQVRQEGQMIVPNINLDAHYQNFTRNGARLADMDHVLQSIAQQVQSQPGLETKWLQDYSQVKDKLYIRVSDAAENEAFLANCPHREVDGLAVSYHIAFDNGQGIQASAAVTNNMLDLYGITPDQLHNDALESAQNLLPANMVSLAEMMGNMMGVDADMVMPTMDEPRLMVLTNDQALHGAGALFYPGQMDAVAQQLGSDYFVLPSSIHEVLLLPDDGSVEYDVLEAMVQDINMTTVAPEEQLSDHVYHYDAKDHILEKASTYEARMEMKEIEAEKATLAAASITAVKDMSHAEDLHAAESPAGKLREAAAAEKEEHADPSGDHRAADHGHEAAERHGETPRKERKSVLARLNDKKEMLSSQPKKDVPSRSKSAELG